jgi:hypothetical protein
LALSVHPVSANQLETLSTCLGTTEMKYAAAFSVLVFAIVPLSAARAGHQTPLYKAACQYREAVREFERGVLRAHCFGRYDERLVDRLEDTTSRLRSAARHPDRVERLLYEWNEIQSLHPRVAEAIFDPARYPHHPQLAQCWAQVQCTFDRFAHQLLLLQIPHHQLPHLGPSVIVVPQAAGQSAPQRHRSEPIRHNIGGGVAIGARLTRQLD